jgi:hypothetical protein
VDLDAIVSVPLMDEKQPQVAKVIRITTRLRRVPRQSAFITALERSLANGAASSIQVPFMNTMTRNRTINKISAEANEAVNNHL